MMASGNTVTTSDEVYIALGANLASAEYGAPRATLEAALALLASQDITILRRSSWWQSSPQPVSDQPDFVNGVVEVRTGLSPTDLLARLHRIESSCGRTRQERWEARVLDLDLIDYRGRVVSGTPVLPHPRLGDRLFVLLPLQEIAPNWRHPVSGAGLAELISAAYPLKINKL